MTGRPIWSIVQAWEVFIRPVPDTTGTPDAARRRAGVYFSVSLRAPHAIDAIAREIGEALQVTLERCSERGLQGDWQGEALGLRLWLFVADPPEPGVPPRHALIGGPEHDCPPGEHWADISDYVSEHLSFRTGRPWTPSTSEGGPA